MKVASRGHTPVSFDRLLLAFANLESYGIDTRILPGTNPDRELTLLRASIFEAFPDGTASCVFLLKRDISCFGCTGTLRRPVHLHHSGADVTKAIGAALAEVGLGIAERPGPHTVTVVDVNEANTVNLPRKSMVPRLHQ